jgi:hypothetical protein
MITRRSAFARSLTLAQFAIQQSRTRWHIANEIRRAEDVPFTVEGSTLSLTAAETKWRSTGLRVRAGQRFAISARGAIWLSKPLSLVMSPKSVLWVRIGGVGPIAKPADNDHVYVAWADGE